MSYGLYDADLPYYPIPFYNLELMKISSYYKHKREIVGLSPDFSPNRYGKFIVRQDFYNSHANHYNVENVEYGGRAFDGEKYKPLPLEIEKMKPDISLYEKLKPKKVKGYSPSALSTMRRAEHIRLSLDSKTIWKDFEKQFRHDNNCYGVIFHDYNLNQIDGAYELIANELPSWIKFSPGRRVGMKFPIQVNNKDDMCKWLSLQPMGTFFSLCHNGLIDNSYIPGLSEVYKQSNAIRQASMDITDIVSVDNIQHIFRTIINLRSYRLIFPLIYNEDCLIDSNWKMVMRLINRYNKHLLSITSSKYFKQVEPFETLYSYCRAVIHKSSIKEPLLSKESVQSIFQFVRENNYELFKDFYEYRGGEVKNDR